MSADDFLADAYAKLPINPKPWQCMICDERFATLAEINTHTDNAHPDLWGDES